MPIIADNVHFVAKHFLYCTHYTNLNERTWCVAEPCDFPVLSSLFQKPHLNISRVGTNS